jgi:hypothetical protein
MSVEIRLRNSHFECDWGRFDNADVDPHHPIRHLMLTTEGYARELLETGPRPGPRGGIHSATRDGGRIFVHFAYSDNRWTWEVHKARFWDGKGPQDIVVGRWPD